jgi:hypothetical protein
MLNTWVDFCGVVLLCCVVLFKEIIKLPVGSRLDQAGKLCYTALGYNQLMQKHKFQVTGLKFLFAHTGSFFAVG